MFDLHITNEAVGFDLYCDLIRETMAELKGEPIPKTGKIEINLNLEAYLPEEFIPDVNQRLNVYKRASMIEEIENINVLGEELKDRYGPLPAPAKHLLKVIIFEEIKGFLISIKT